MSWTKAVDVLTVTKANNNDHPMHITLFQDTFDNTADNGGDVTWSQFKELVQNHTISEVKKGTLAFNCWRFKEKTDDYTPATVKLEDGTRVTKLDVDGNDFVGRLSENCIEVSAVILDFDGGVSISQAKKKCRKQYK